MLNQEKYKKKNITLRKTAESEDVMSVYEMSRWMSLIEAVDIISDKCKTLDMNDKDHSWIKPIAIQKYVDERTEGILFELTNQNKL
tara:strand:+ start:425 stop:682 length:258 start_codon:yes stop_codon:yes gene_type:complete